MDKDQFARLQRHRKVQQVLIDNAAVVVTVPAFARLATQYQQRLALLDGAAQKNAVTSEGATLAKGAAGLALIGRLVKAANALYLLYKAEDDQQEAAKLHRRASDYTNMRDLQLATEATDLSKRLTARQADLKDYNVAAADVTALAADAASFSSLLTAPQLAIDDAKIKGTTATATLNGLNLFLKDELRSGMELLKDTHPEMYQALREASQVDDARLGKSGKKSATGIAKNSGSSVALTMFLLLMATLCMQPRVGYAQTEEIIQAKRIDDRLTIGFNPSGLTDVRYAIDRDFKATKAKRLMKEGSTAVAAIDEFNIVTTFANPLVYKVVIAESASKDPNAKAANEFLSTFGQLFGQIGAISSTKTNPVVTSTTTSAGAGTGPSLKNSPTTATLSTAPDIRSPEILNLILWLEQNKPTVSESVTARNRIDTIKAVFDKAEDNLYSFPDSARKLVQSIAAPITYAAVSSALPKIEANLKHLEKMNTDARPLIENVKQIGKVGLVETYFSTEAVAAKYLPLDKFIRSTATTYSNTYTERLVARDTLVKYITRLVNGMKTTLGSASYESEGTHFITQHTVAGEKGEIKEVSVEISRIKLSFIDNNVLIKEDKVFSSKIRVRPFSYFVLEPSAGVLITNLTYPDYGTETNAAGKTVVANAGADRVNFVPAAMLNVFLMRGHSDALPVLQLGVGTGKDSRPTLFTGLGLRFFSPNRLTFSIGSLFSFQQVLGSLQIGQEVSGTAAVKSDLKYELGKPKLALGIQYSF
jgi:hypothetical protein